MAQSDILGEPDQVPVLGDFRWKSVEVFFGVFEACLIEQRGKLDIISIDNAEIRLGDHVAKFTVAPNDAIE